MMCEEISLCVMTRALCRELYQKWENDPAIYMDMDLFAPYQYNENAVNKYFDSKQHASRILFAIMKDGRPIGELQLKEIDPERKECTLSIHMQNDAVKGRGYGTCAEKLALKYAFDVLGMEAVNADTVIKNVRSQHVLEKIGFQFIGEKDGFKYYRYERTFSFDREVYFYQDRDGISASAPERNESGRGIKQTHKTGGTPPL